MTNATRKPENQEIGGKSEKKGFGKEEPLETGRFGTISKGFKERIMRNLRDAAIAASLRFGSIKGVPESPVATNVDTREGRKETNGPMDRLEHIDASHSTNLTMDGVSELIIGMKDGRVRIGEIEASASLGLGDTIPASEGFTVALLEVGLNGEGEYGAKITVYAPWLKEDLVFRDVREGGCVSVPLPDGTETGVYVRNISGGILPVMGTALIDILRDAGTVKNEG